MEQKTPSGMVFMRIELGITQQQLADILGVSRSLLAMAERGHRRLPGTVLPCLQELRAIARKVPYTPKPSRRRRPSVASKRPAYNRILFTTRRYMQDKSHIVTLHNSLPILSATELADTAERITQAPYFDSNETVTSLTACRELLLTLQQKRETLQCRMEVLELDKAAARERGFGLKVDLSVVKARLKAYRQNFKAYPDMRKSLRKRIAVDYVKKLELMASLEKYNKPAILKRKQLIMELAGDLKGQQGLEHTIQKRLMELENRKPGEANEKNNVNTLKPVL